jgi:hypothetical protein
MKRLLLIGGLAALLAGPVLATDHNNLDAGRPLDFDDADPVAFREQDLEIGFHLGAPRAKPLGFGAGAEYLYGFSLNSQLMVGLDPRAGGRAGSGETGADPGNLTLGALHQFHREHGRTPAFALRADVALPTGRGSRGADFRLRGIWTKSVRQYDRVHLNLDLQAATDPRRGSWPVNPGMILGYSHPLGYPRRFDRTFLAQLGVQAGPRVGAGPIVTVGVGVRQQVTVRSVLDIGLESDAGTFNGAPGDRVRLIAGYSTAF